MDMSGTSEWDTDRSLTVVLADYGAAFCHRRDNSKLGTRVQEEHGVQVARLAGIEPATLGFGGQYSIH